MVSMKSVKQRRTVVLEPLENRQLFAVQLDSGALSTLLAHTDSPASDSVDLSTQFSNSAVPGTVVRIKTNLGNIDVALTDKATPLTVKNFLAYISSGAYNNTIFHRSSDLNTNKGGSPTAPATIIQGGGYVVDGKSITHIATNAALHDEFSIATLKNVAGTLAMAKTSSANSATSEFYFNVSDNTSLDTPTTDSSGTQTSYTVFGTVINGMNFVKKIASLRTVNVSFLNSALNTLPVQGVSGSQPVRPANLVYTRSMQTFAGNTFMATSDNPKLVLPVVNGNSMSFNYASTATGVAHITIVAHSFDNTTATQTITITVPPRSGSTGPTANADTATVITGQTTPIKILANDTATTGALDPASISITQQPAHGTLTQDATTGNVKYTPNSGYTGTDTFKYTVQDTSNATSAAATVALTVVSAPSTVSLGGAGAKVMKIAEPDGTVGTVSVGGGTAVITLAGTNVTTKTAGGITTVTGADATIASIVITNATNKAASLNIHGAGGTDKILSVGSITDAGAMQGISASGVNLTGTLSAGGLAALNLTKATNAVISIGDSKRNTRINISSATDSSLSEATGIASFITGSWLNTDGQADAISAPSIWKLASRGEFDAGLALSDTGTSLNSASIGGTVTGAWSIGGNAGNVSAAAASDTFALTAAGNAAAVRFTGNMAGNLTASTITSLVVGKSLLGANVKTTAQLSSTALSIGSIVIGLSFSDSQIMTAGDIGSITAKSIIRSEIYAGVSSSVVTAGHLPTSSTDFTSAATIRSVNFTGASPAFSDSKIAAQTIKAIHLGVIKTDNSGTTEGVAAKTLSALTGTLSTGKKLVLTKKQLADATTLSTYLNSKSISLGDFVITLV